MDLLNRSIVTITSHMLVTCFLKVSWLMIQSVLVGRAITVFKLTADPGLLGSCHYPSLKCSRIFSEADGTISTFNGFVVFVVRLVKRHAREFSYRFCEHPVVFELTSEFKWKGFHVPYVNRS